MKDKCFFYKNNDLESLNFNKNLSKNIYKILIIKILNNKINNDVLFVLS